MEIVFQLEAFSGSWRLTETVVSAWIHFENYSFIVIETKLSFAGIQLAHMIWLWLAIMNAAVPLYKTWRDNNVTTYFDLYFYTFNGMICPK